MNQDEIYVQLKARMHAAGFLNAQEAAVPSWTTAHERAWQSFAYHKLGRPSFELPHNETAMREFGLLDELEQEYEVTPDMEPEPEPKPESVAEPETAELPKPEPTLEPIVTPAPIPTQVLTPMLSESEPAPVVSQLPTKEENLKSETGKDSVKKD